MNKKLLFLLSCALLTSCGNKNNAIPSNEKYYVSRDKKGGWPLGYSPFAYEGKILIVDGEYFFVDSESRFHGNIGLYTTVYNFNRDGEVSESTLRFVEDGVIAVAGFEFNEMYSVDSWPSKAIEIDGNKLLENISVAYVGMTMDQVEASGARLNFGKE